MISDGFSQTKSRDSQQNAVSFSVDLALPKNMAMDELIQLAAGGMK